MEFGKAFTRKRRTSRKSRPQKPLNIGVTAQPASHHACFWTSALSCHLVHWVRPFYRSIPMTENKARLLAVVLGGEVELTMPQSRMAGIRLSLPDGKVAMIDEHG